MSCKTTKLIVRVTFENGLSFTLPKKKPLDLALVEVFSESVVTNKNDKCTH